MPKQPDTTQHRKKPSKGKHAAWRNDYKRGLSSGQIALKWRVTPSAVIRALERSSPTGRAAWWRGEPHPSALACVKALQEARRRIANGQPALDVLDEMITAIKEGQNHDTVDTEPDGRK